MNKLILSGRLTREPVISYTQGENPSATARFTLAVDRKVKKDGAQNADFIPCVAWGKTAEVVEKYLHQGTKIMLEGRWITGNYVSKNNVKVYTNDCAVDSIEFAEKKQEQTAPAQQADGDGFMNIPDGLDDELPFN